MASSRRLPAAVTACAAQLLVVADANAMAIALPSVGRSLAVGDAALQWVLSANALCFGACLLLAGRAADAFGRRRMLIAGAAGFAAAAGVAAVSTSLAALVVARAAQGIAAAAMIPAALALVAGSAAEPDARGRGVSGFGSMVAVGFAVGVLGGGWLVGAAGWRAVPLAALAVAVAIATLAAVATALDVPGAGAARPPPSRALLRAAALRLALAAAVLALATSAGFTYALTLYLQEVLGYAPLSAGVLFLGFGAGGVAAGLVAPRLVRGAALVRVLAAGLLLQAGGSAALALHDPRLAPALVAPAIALVGAGNVLATVSFTLLALAAVPATAQATAGGLIGTAQQIGATAGLVVTGGVAAAAGDLATRLDRAFLAAGAISTTAALLVRAMRGRAPAAAARARPRRRA